MGISHTLKFLDVASSLVVDAVKLSKGGLGWGSYQKALAMIAQVNALLVEAKLAMPELGDLDSKESIELGAAAYAAIAKIVAAA